ncbi:hypothetical protein [Streptomyces tsukubensis]|uniref:DNA-directed RNA polymerase specialized sigma24 family protein n=1 Tax=Streptomyces tsukubensis TaxID=83656 RepID=A0A1V3ZYR4_9ACTN|nr:hypothetical protein [Streptomyces tsukubensis]OON71578.1 hypothetical protein B1H18_33230 [Streptomyces tsukubensis]QFR93245.1 hypothetical protein GBW32_09295 [Streptomyces tsukubensis]
MQSQDLVTRPEPDPEPVSVDVEQAEAALIEHYPRLVRLAYLVLPPGPGRARRVLTAHALTQRALPRGRAQTEGLLPAQRGSGQKGHDAGYAYVRLRVVRSALETGRSKRGRLPHALPQVWGLRLAPRSGGADELALEHRLADLSGPARAAFALRGLEGLGDEEAHALLDAAGVDDPGGALASAERVTVAPGVNPAALLASPEFDPCSLQARPTDLLRRRQHGRAALVATAALVVCGALLGLPGDSPDGAAAPPYARNPAQQAALDPGRLTVASGSAWRESTRTDFSVWPARGALVKDRELLRRALAVWARPGGGVQVSATPGTPSGAPSGPAQLLYAGKSDRARVVLFYDGLRVVRYAEALDDSDAVALDLARVDGADAASSSALVVDRTDGNVRYLTAPWVRGVAVRDLLKPTEAASVLKRSGGVTDPFVSPPQKGSCTSWRVLETRTAEGTRLLSDLGELIPAHLTGGTPTAPREVSTPAARAAWAPSACTLTAARAHGVRSVNSWSYASQQLPEGNGVGDWSCTRMDTWSGTDNRVFAGFRAPGTPSAAVAAKAEESPACGPRDPNVLAGVLWKSKAGHWYVLAGANDKVDSLRSSGDASGAAQGHVLAVPAEQGAQAELTGVLAGGKRITALR